MSSSTRPTNTPRPSFGMSGGWRTNAFAKLAKVKDYVASTEVSKNAYAAVSNRIVAYRTGVDPTTGEKRQTWEEWAKEKRQRRREEQKGVEKISLFPGWAVRRYPEATRSKGKDDIQQFTIDVFVSGFASSLRTPEQATRSQRAFMRIARGFSALPRLPPPPQNILGGSGTTSPFTQSPNPSTDDLTEELARMGVVLPPRPNDITQETEAQALKSRTQQPKVEKTQNYNVTDYGANEPASGVSTPGKQSPTFYSSRPQPFRLPSRSPTITTQAPSPISSPKNERSDTGTSFSSMLSAKSNTEVSSISPDMDIGILRQLHANLDARLQPFWSSKLENRTVRITLYTRSPDTPSSDRGKSQDPVPLASSKVQTNAQGYFAQKFCISFEELCTHDQALHIAFGDHKEEPPLFIRAELLPSWYAPNSSGFGAEVTGGMSIEQQGPRQSSKDLVRVQTELLLSTARVRVISDIDDTIKISEVLMGIKSIFHNVFVRHLDELIVPGMPELYAKIAARGAKFHYVSNSPFELLPMLNDFFGISELPRGSVKLKSYGGRNLFQAAERKRGNVVEVLDSFPESRFILVGDTGEQDLELYSALAEERPHQIIAIFLRDVTPATPPPTAPPSPTLPPVPNNTIKKKGSTSSLRSIRSLAGGSKRPTEELPKLQIPPPQVSQESRAGTPGRSMVYTPSTARGRALPGSYFDTPTAVRRPPPLPPTKIPFGEANLDMIDPAGALVSAAATAGTGHSAEATDTTRAGILEKKEALRLRMAAAKARVPEGIVLRAFKQPWECEDDAMAVIDDLEKKQRFSWSTGEELLAGRR
ncbi:hypothetical protein BDV93DRAFT_28854 [Ceratobasidium sp. AG-I]|nr:hypothetical protein BDV93DRAFT_28854 [Ceratobasidium sp. AG-I]